ncbi:MAG: hypothetical protein FWD73_16970 [Polyangiaceae bacterium]|nr:hypothetical protein [Polyangiaceae bacterium]
MAESTSSSISARLDAIEAQLKEIVKALYGSSGAAGAAPTTTTIELTDSEFDKIADALDDLDAKLTDRQRLYMFAIFGAAASHFATVLSAESPQVANIRTIQVQNADKISNVKLSDTFHSLVQIDQGKLGSMVNQGTVATSGGATTSGGTVMDSVTAGVSVSAGVVSGGVTWSKSDGGNQVGSWQTMAATPIDDHDLGGGNPTGNLQASSAVNQSQVAAKGGIAGLPGGFTR